jgi:hypothetical protein
VLINRSSTSGLGKLNVDGGADITGGNVLLCRDTGNVGIGTASPGARLDVSGDALVNGLTVGRGAGSVASNTVVGSGALPVNTTGTSNTAVGGETLEANTTGALNTAIGRQALEANINGNANTAVGSSALRLNYNILNANVSFFRFFTHFKSSFFLSYKTIISYYLRFVNINLQYK